MRDIEIMRLEADGAFREFILSVEGVDERQAWAKIECQPGEYLHSEGSILSIVAHVAACKFLYGSAAYRDLEVRWRDTVASLEGFWPSWEGAKRYLNEAQDYWLASWSEETDLERKVSRFNGDLWPNWKIISTVTHHDSHHAGQIHMLRSVLAPSPEPPPAEGDLWRRACRDLPSW